MVLKKSYPAFECMVSVEGDKELLEYFPEEFLAEVERFIRRNSLVSVEGRCEMTVDRCCERCLKAHAMLRAKEMGLDNNAMKFLHLKPNYCQKFQRLLILIPLHHNESHLLHPSTDHDTSSVQYYQ